MSKTPAAQRRWSVTIAAASLFTLFSATAWSHGATPQARSIIPTAGQPGWIVETNFGFILGQTPDQFICEESFLGGLSFRLVTLDEQTWLIATETGVVRSLDGGCSFEKVSPLSELPKALVKDPISGAVLYLTQQPDLSSPLWISVEPSTGAFAPLNITLPPLDEVKWTSARFLWDGRLFVLGYSNKAEDRGQGRAWLVDVQANEVQELEGMAGLKYPYLLSAEQDQLAGVATDDQGTVIWWDKLEQLGQRRIRSDVWPSALAIDPETPSKLWVTSSDPISGGVRAITLDAQAQPQWQDHWIGQSASCVWPTSQDKLFVCVDRAQTGSDVVQIGRAAPGEAQPIVSFTALTGAQTRCDMQTQAGQTCPLVWDELAKQLRLNQPGDPDMGAALDQGVPTDMSDMGQAPSAATKAESGCSVASPQRRAAASGWALALLALGLMRLGLCGAAKRLRQVG